MIYQDSNGHYPFTNEPFYYEDLEFFCSGTIIPGTQSTFDEPPEETYIENLIVTLPPAPGIPPSPPLFKSPHNLDVTWYIPDFLYDLIHDTLLEDLAWRI